MKRLPLLLVVLSTVYSFAQSDSTKFNRVSASLAAGFNNPTNPVAMGYDAATLTPGYIGLNGKVMINSMIGMNLRVGYDLIKGSKKSLGFSTNCYSFTLEGVVNTGKLLHFNDWTSHLGLQSHFGVGYSTIKEKRWEGEADKMMNACIGLTGMYKFNDRVSMLLDFTSFAHVYQTYTYDFTETYFKRGVDGYNYNFTVGLQYTFGKGKSIEWVGSNSLEEKMKALKEDLAELDQRQGDADNDGVPNYLDIEPNTVEGATVNTKGQAIEVQDDQDKDGVRDRDDACPFEKGSVKANGCPDADEDGVTDLKDECPTIPGEDGKGCPVISSELISAIELCTSDVKFDGKKTTLTPAAKAALDRLALGMKLNPMVKMTVLVHGNGPVDSKESILLTQQRADAIRVYLISRGTPITQLRSFGIGNNEPLVDPASSEAPVVNNRVMYKTSF
jgi:OOP family OmpA-OmpF porin